MWRRLLDEDDAKWLLAIHPKGSTSALDLFECFVCLDKFCLGEKLSSSGKRSINSIRQHAASGSHIKALQVSFAMTCFPRMNMCPIWIESQT